MKQKRQEEKGRGKREDWRGRIKASWVSIIAGRQLRVAGGGAYQLHGHLCILLASQKQHVQHSGVSAVVNRCRQPTAGTGRQEEGKCVFFLFGVFSRGHIHMLVAPRLSPWTAPPFLSVSPSLDVLIPNICMCSLSAVTS